MAGNEPLIPRHGGYRKLKIFQVAQMKLASEKGLPPMRPVFFDFADDPKTAEVEDQFLFGPDLLVAPITRYEERSREVYLPSGTEWTDAWTDKELPGGQIIEVDAPIERIPVYVRGKNADLLRLFKELYSESKQSRALAQIPDREPDEQNKHTSTTKYYSRRRLMSSSGRC